MSEGAVALKHGEYVAVEGDSEKHIPDKHVGHPIAPNYFCRFWNSRRQKYCRARAGRGTSHLGRGRCGKHDGGSDKKIKHGLRSMYLVGSPKMLERIQRMESDPTLLDMRNELTILCALLDEALGKEKVERSAIERLSVEASRMKERIHNASAKNAFSVEQMKRFWFNMNRTIELVLKDEPELCAKLQQSIGQISI